MKIVITDGFAVNPGDLSWDIFKQFGQVEIYKDTPNTLAAQRIGDADIAIINKTVIDEQLLQQCPNLKLICVAATGYNVVDCAATKKRGIPVCNVPGYGTAAVAQFTFSLLLELCNRVGHHDLLVHEGEWGQRGGFCFWDTPQTELAGKTMGIIGYGTIGQAVGKIAEAFGMHVLAFNRSHTVKGADYVSLEELLQKSDIISLHCPYTPETHQIINSRTIAQMKDGAILLNTARGGVINEADVAKALLSGKLRGAAVDVVSTEPILEDNPLYTAPNCIITPHMAWAPKESRQRIIDSMVQSICSWQAGKPTNVVNL